MKKEATEDQTAGRERIRQYLEAASNGQTDKARVALRGHLKKEVAKSLLGLLLGMVALGGAFAVLMFGVVAAIKLAWRLF
jgi:hypothetical protein